MGELCGLDCHAVLPDSRAGYEREKSLKHRKYVQNKQKNFDYLEEKSVSEKINVKNDE